MGGRCVTGAAPSFIAWQACGPIATTWARQTLSSAPSAAPSGRSATRRWAVPRYLLDTDVIIEWLRRSAPIVAWLDAHDAAGDLLACTPVTIAELYAGV